MAMSDTNGPPTQFELSKVVISLVFQTGMGLPGGYEISVNGMGEVRSTPHGEGSQAPAGIKKLDQDEHVELINGFYEVGFFDLPASNLVTKQVVMRNNWLATIATKMSDIGSKKLCIEISDYKKCVTRAEDNAGDVVGLIEKIESLAGIHRK